MEFAGFSKLPMSWHGAQSGRDSWAEESLCELAATVFVAASLLLHAADGGLSQDMSLRELGVSGEFPAGLHSFSL